MYRLLVGFIFTILSQVSFADNCDKSSLVALPEVSYQSVISVDKPVKHCKVAGVIGSEIGFELLLPQSWNGKFAMGGGGGFVGSIQNVALMFGALEAGYATVGTDTGHRGNGIDASWAYNNQERLVNFGHQAVHRTAVNSKAIVASYYKGNIDKSYFVGCSRGGGQALISAQRYPADFDGIAAGAPAYSWSGLAAQAINSQQAMFPTGDLSQAILSEKDQAMMEDAILNHCDANDGIKDRILNDPRKCDFDIASLQCTDNQQTQCLTSAQVNAAKAIYNGPSDQKGKLFYGFPFGGESGAGGWSQWQTGGISVSKMPIPNATFGFGTGIMKYFVYNDPDWDYASYDFTHFRKDTRLMASTLNATNADLSTFRERGGKLLITQGWSDPAISALGTIGYYEEVVAHDNSAADDVRLFMMPGVLHCRGGRGPSQVNVLAAVDSWVTNGKAPNQIEAHYPKGNSEVGSRLLCPYPQVAKYLGKGNVNSVDSYRCK